MDLVGSITGLEIEAVLADLTTVHPIRKRPKGEVETFSGKLGGPRETEPVAITTEDYGCILFRFQGGARGSLWVSQVTAGRKNCIRYEIAGSNVRPGLGQRVAQRAVDRPPRPAQREPDPRPGPASAPWPAATSTIPAATTRAFPTPSSSASARSTATSRRATTRRQPLFPTFAEGHREVVLCEAILKSHRQQRWVNV